jgi:glycine/D-amino acid oxidase-like deaminating enzyme
MTYVYEPDAYSQKPIATSYWPTTVASPTQPQLIGQHQADVAIIGAGFTGLNAAHHLSQAGANVVVLDAQSPAFGASGRNGGFCCLGGGKISNAALIRSYGADQQRLYRDAEHSAVAYVDNLTTALNIDIDRHSNGETLLAHSPRAARHLTQIHDEIAADYNVTPTLHSRDDLTSLGMQGHFFGGITTPIGFGLNPRKYLLGLLAKTPNLTCFANSPVQAIIPTARGYQLTTPQGSITASKFVIATNGYTSETMFPWMTSRFLPVQSSVIVTEPISPERQQKQGWFSDQMAYDTRFLLHYFRRLPNGRFLFGMRGGLQYTPASEAVIKTTITRKFRRLFPNWHDVAIDHYWSGLVAMNRNLAPFVGEIPGYPGGYAGFGYHGNGVAMGSYAGAILADLIATGSTDRAYPTAFARAPKRYPLGRHRRWLLAPIYRIMPWIEG